MRAYVVTAGDGDPLRRVAGLTVLERCARLARLAGAASVEVVEPDDARRARLAAALPGLTFAARLADDPSRPRLLLDGTVVFGRQVARALAAHVPPAGGALALCDGDGGRLGAWRVAPGVVLGPMGGVVGAVRDVRLDGTPAAAAADDPAAEALVWAAGRKPFDGLVARHLNRPVSLAISRVLVHTPVTPNHVTIACMVLGLIGAACIARGGYEWTLLGALLFQLNSIVDGVDGELARVKLAESRLGQLLDNLCDGVTLHATFAAVLVNAAQGGMGLAVGFGAVGLALNLAFLLAVGRKLRRVGRCDIRALTRPLGGDPPVVAIAVRLGWIVLRRDTLTFLVLLLAAADALPVLLYLAPLGSVAALVALALRLPAPAVHCA